MVNNRVLQVLEGLDIGGKEICAMNFYRNIDREKIQFDFAIHSSQVGFFEPEIKELGGQIFHYALAKGHKNSLSQFVYNMACFHKFIKRKDYDIVHIHGCSFYAILTASIPCKIQGVKNIIAHAHNPGTPSGGRLDKILRKVLKGLIAWSCNQYFTCSDLAAESKYTRKILKQNLTYIHNAIELNKFKYTESDRSEIRSKYNVDEDQILLGIVGRLEEQKNHKYLIEIFEKLYKKDDRYKLIIVGTGSLEEELKEKVKRLNLQSAVIFTGNTPTPSKFYSAMDVFVLPSLYEGFPFVMIEAQANGLPCVISNEITRAVCLLKTTYQLPIEKDSVNQWVKQIESIFFTGDRKKAVDILKKQGFDIEDEVERMQELYIKMKGGI